MYTFVWFEFLIDVPLNRFLSVQTFGRCESGSDNQIWRESSRMNHVKWTIMQKVKNFRCDNTFRSQSTSSAWGVLSHLVTGVSCQMSVLFEFANWREQERRGEGGRLCCAGEKRNAQEMLAQQTCLAMPDVPDTNQTVLLQPFNQEQTQPRHGALAMASPDLV